jgi:hypothetical protein
MYNILKYSYEQAEKLNVEIKPSKHKNKKIDVYKDGVFMCSIGDSRYLDYPHYLLEDKELAEKKRKLYHIRHKKDNVIDTPGYYALNILW